MARLVDMPHIYPTSTLVPSTDHIMTRKSVCPATCSDEVSQYLDVEESTTSRAMCRKAVWELKIRA
ncbi:hypothetical protein PAXRUDRAFT_821002 [Paxillus rubicundulus Ve08.2h10]|uniref:Uncharacterized protein n=1 Tax=Paxillus rubicundulus Ve08.2h10 TaxID=930991 RepID=A0A0D0DPJ7_9AGAM|nr:hypothetical protein PAXRUDRAFT_821002 [Paxillus rubicundulus Ve08.2h10]